MAKKKFSEADARKIMDAALLEKSKRRLKAIRGGKWSRLKRLAKELLGGEQTYLPKGKGKGKGKAQPKKGITNIRTKQIEGELETHGV
ncbi:unnamed protein product, partial [marine sediment metagenome]